MDVKKIYISEIQIGERSRKDLGDLASLMKSMHGRGLINPITVDTENNLICGERRLASAQNLGWETIDCHVISSPDDLLPMHLEQDENDCRLDPSPEEKVRMGKRIEALEKPKAKERQSQGGRNKLGSRDPNLTEGAKTTEIVADHLDMGEASYRRAKRVVEAADAHPENEAIQDALREMNESSHVMPAYSKVIDELKNLGEVRAYKTKNEKQQEPKEKPNAINLKTHKEDTFGDATRACETVEHAVAELEKMKLDTLETQDAATLHDGIFALRTRITRIITFLKGHSNDQDDSEKAQS